MGFLRGCRLAALIAALAAAAALAACGGGDDSSTSAATAQGDCRQVEAPAPKSEHFPKPGPMPPVPESKGDAQMDAPPGDLPTGETLPKAG